MTLGNSVTQKTVL